MPKNYKGLSQGGLYPGAVKYVKNKISENVKYIINLSNICYLFVYWFIN